MKQITLYTHKDAAGWRTVIRAELAAPPDGQTAWELNGTTLWTLVAIDPDREYWESSKGESATNRLF